MIAFAAGLIFALGLGLSGMTLPTKVTGFLDFFGDVDPSLALVMVGAIGVNLAPTLWRLNQGSTWSGTALHLPDLTAIDARLVGGAALFGIGWGLGGYCPGPGLVAAGAGQVQALTFVASMLAGMAAFEAFDSLRHRTSEAGDSVAAAPKS